MRRRSYPDVKPGQRSLSASAFNDQVQAVEALSRMQASRGIRLSTGASGVQIGPDEVPRFRVRLTANAGGQYSWVEVIENGTGGWTVLNDGRSGGPGNWPAYEQNSATVATDPSTGPIVELRPGQVGEYYEFDASGAMGAGAGPNDICYFRNVGDALNIWHFTPSVPGQNTNPYPWVGNTDTTLAWAVPFPTPRGGSIDAIGICANAMPFSFLGVYDSASPTSVLPNQLLAQHNVAATAGAFVSAPLNLTFQAGRLYWLAWAMTDPTNLNPGNPGNCWGVQPVNMCGFWPGTNPGNPFAYGIPQIMSLGAYNAAGWTQLPGTWPQTQAAGLRFLTYTFGPVQGQLAGELAPSICVRFSA